MKKTLLLSSFVFVAIIGYILYKNIVPQKMNNVTQKTIRYVAMGDSYTIGMGVAENKRYPNLLVDRLNKEGLNVQLISNLAVSGYTTQDVLEHEVPGLQSLNPNFVTLLIGANDAFQKLDYEVFRKNYDTILTKILEILPSTKNIVVITIPNFAVSPAGLQYVTGKNESERIEKYNDIIQEEAEQRNIQVIDLFSKTKDIQDQSYFISDGLHPSGKQYEEWVDVIFPTVQNIVKEIN